MKAIKNLFSFGLILMAGSLVFTSCSKDNQSNSNATGYVFTESNQIAGNFLIQYSRDTSGALTFLDSVSTGGIGTGAGLGSQNAVIISSNGNYVFVVNGGDNSVSSFSVSSTGAATLIGHYTTQGVTPVSVTDNGSYAYVLCNSGGVTPTGVSTVEGFTLSSTGALAQVSGSLQTLSSTGANPAQISFINGNVLVVTEKAADKLATFTVTNGIAGNLQTFAAQTQTMGTQPFGFSIGTGGYIYVSEANMASALSTYLVSATGVITNVATQSNSQAGACWTVITSNQKYVYTINAGAANVSSFSIGASGAISSNVVAAQVAPTTAHPLDATVDKSSKYLYVLASGNEQILGYTINADGSLTAIPGATINGLSASDVGMAGL